MTLAVVTYEPEEQIADSLDLETALYEQIGVLKVEEQRISDEIKAREPVPTASAADWESYRSWRHRAYAARRHLQLDRRKLRAEYVRLQADRLAQRQAQRDANRAENERRQEARQMRTANPRPVTGPTLATVIAQQWTEHGIDFTTSELENMQRRLRAEASTLRVREFLVELVTAFSAEHGQHGEDCANCALIATARRDWL